MTESSANNYGEIANLLKQAQDERARSHRNGDKEDADVKILGGLFEVSPTIANFMRIGYKGYLEKQISKGGEDWIRNNGEKLFNTVTKDADKAKALAGSAGNAFGWAWLLSEPLVGVYNTVNQYGLDRQDLAKKLQPLTVSHEEKSHKFTVGSYKNNEMVQHEMERISTKFRRNFATDVIASSFNFIPQAILKKREQFKRINPTEAATANPFINDEFMDKVVNPAAALLGNELKNSTNKKNTRGSKKETALSKTLKLSEEIERRGAITRMDGKALDDYIEEIFQTHQEDMGRKPIGERYQEDLDYAAKEIAKAISTGKLHPMALIDIVGDGMIVHHEGKAIASRAQVAEVLNQLSNQIPAHYDIDVDKYLSESAHTKDDLKHLLESSDPHARDLLASLIPDEILKNLGWKQEEIKNVHERTEKTLAKDLQAVVLDLNSLSDEQLHEYKLQDKEISLLRQIAKESKTKGTSAVLGAVSTFGEFRKGIEWPVVNAKQYWEDIAAGKIKIGDLAAKAEEEKTVEAKASDVEKPAKEERSFAERVRKAEPPLSRTSTATFEDEEEEHHAHKADKAKAASSHKLDDEHEKPNTQIHAAMHHKTARTAHASAHHATH